MSLAYFNGAFLPLAEIHLSPLDRGFLFADGVYEVIPVFNGRALRLPQHLSRWRTSLAALDIVVPEAQLPGGSWTGFVQVLLAHYGVGDWVIYLQVTRGAPAIRDHGIVSPDTAPTVFAMVSPLKPVPARLQETGVRTITVPDERGLTCHIKSVALLANVLARRQALAQGVHDALLVRDGWLLESPAANVFWVRDGVIATAPKDQRILGGITRDLVLELAATARLPFMEQALPVSELATIDELWLTSSTKDLLPVTQVNGRPVGKGVPGTHWRQMMALYQAYKENEPVVDQ